MLEPAAINAGMDIVKLLGGQTTPDGCSRSLELPDVERLAFVWSMCQRGDALALAEILADIEEDLSGRTRGRLIDGLHATLA